MHMQKKKHLAGIVKYEHKLEMSYQYKLPIVELKIRLVPALTLSLTKTETNLWFICELMPWILRELEIQGL